MRLHLFVRFLGNAALEVGSEISYKFQQDRSAGGF
jgi:hypothetical protein